MTVTSERVFRRWDYPIFAVLTVVNVAAVAWFLRYWFGHADSTAHLIAYAVLTMSLLLGVAMFESRWLALPLMRRPCPVAPRDGLKVGVATTFVPALEPIEMLEETVRALAAMDYAHDTWVLDEGDDPRVRELCDRLGAHHFSRKDKPQYLTTTGTFEARSKHGNYNAWLTEVGFERYELIVSFDPDHVPSRHYLTSVIGYFADPSVGYVQAAQVYYNQSASFIARGAAEETYAYYSSIQMSSYAIGYPIVTGCHTTHRTTALRSVGGFAPHEADDLLITLLYRAAGWNGVYVPRRLAVGLTPVDWRGYITQQRRWARSVLDVKFRAFPRLAGRLRFPERVFSLVHGLYYLHGLSAAVTIAVLTTMLANRSAPGVVSFSTLRHVLVMVVALQLCDFYRQRFFLDPRRECGLHWRAGVLRIAKWPWVLVALMEALTPRRGPYVMTAKLKDRSGRRLLAPPQIAVAAIIAVAWAVGTTRGPGANPVLDVIAAAFVVSAITLALTEWLPFPAPYDRALQQREEAVSGGTRMRER